MRAKEVLMEKVFLICACTSILFILIICGFLVFGGVPAMSEIGFGNFLLGSNWTPMNIPQNFGLFPMIIASIYVTIGAFIIGVPIGIFTAVFLAYICPKSLYKLLKPAVNLLAGIPSVVYGFFGMVVIVPFVRNISLGLTGGGTGASILSASLLLGIMILPTVVAISEASLKAVPDNYYEGALALGASHVRAVFYVLIPAAKSGILSSVILGIGRAIGETMAVVMVVGNQALIPTSILQGARPLTSNIVLEMAYATGLHRDALIATGVVLLVFILTLNIIFNVATRKRA